MRHWLANCVTAAFVIWIIRYNVYVNAVWNWIKKTEEADKIPWYVETFFYGNELREVKRRGEIKEWMRMMHQRFS